MSGLPELTGKNLSYGILLYFWGIRGILNADVPQILPDTLVSFTTAGSVGFLLCTYTGLDSSIDYCRRMSPQLLTTRGIFSYDGDFDVISIADSPYMVFYGNGCNYDGEKFAGNVGIICPPDQVVQVGQNRLIATEFKKRTVPDDIVFSHETKAVLFGDTPSPVFDIDIKDLNNKLSAELNTQRELANMYHLTANRAISVLNQHADFTDISKKVDLLDSKLIEIGKRVKPDRGPGYFAGIEDGDE